MAMEDEGFQTKTKVEKILAELKEANINFENYKTYVTKKINTSDIISGQVESLGKEFTSLNKKFKEIKNSKRYSRAEEDGYIPIEALKLSEEIVEVFKDAFSWKALDSQIANLAFDKISGVLDDAKALDIKRDALKEMREMENKRNEMQLKIVQDTNAMVQDIVNDKLRTIDEKIINSMKFIMKEMNLEKKESLKLLLEAINKLDIDSVQLNKKIEKKMEEEKELDEDILVPVKKVEIKPKKEEVKVKKSSKKDPFDTSDDDNDEELDEEENDLGDEDYNFKGD